MFFSGKAIFRLWKKIRVFFCFDSQYINLVSCSDINIADRTSDPVLVYRYFINRIVIGKLDIVKNVVGRKSDCQTLCNIPVWINDFIRTVTQQELCMNITIRLTDHIFCPHFL